MELFDNSKKSAEDIIEILKDLKNKAKTEKYWLEMKKSASSLDTRQICPFLNKNGGVILIGVDEAKQELVGVNKDYSNSFTYNKIVTELQSYGNEIDFAHHIETDTLQFESRTFGIVRVKPLIDDLVIFDGRVYHNRTTDGRSEYIEKKSELIDFIAKKTISKDDIQDFLALLSNAKAQFANLSMWNAALEPKTKKEMYGNPSLTPSGLVTTGTLPKPINFSEYKRLRAKYRALLALNSEIELQEKSLISFLEAANFIIGNEPVTTMHLNGFMTRLAHFKLSRQNEWINLISRGSATVDLVMKHLVSIQ